MSHFSDQFIADCDRRTTDDDHYDRIDGVSSKPTLHTAPAPFTKTIEMQFAPAGKRTKFVGFVGQLKDESGIVLHSQLYETKPQAERALDALTRELLIDYAERGLVDTVGCPVCGEPTPHDAWNICPGKPIELFAQARARVAARRSSAELVA